MSHLETTVHPRKSQRVYRSPSSINDPSPVMKKEIKQEEEDDLMTEMDAEDKEASTILMALAQHANRILNDNPSKSSSMSIRNLLDGEAALKDPSILPFQSFSNESKPFYESRRNSNLKKGFKISLQQRNPQPSLIDENYNLQQPSFRPNNLKFKRNATHIHISYRIHAHQTSILSRSKFYPSAFHPAQSMSTPNPHYRDWNHHSSHSLSSHN